MEGRHFTCCNFTPSDCQARDMFDEDTGSKLPRRFGGIEFVPATIQMLSHGASEARDSVPAVSEACYNDFVPLLYGTVWGKPPVAFLRNYDNLNRIEALLGFGKINQVVKVLVNDIEIPIGITAGRNMTS